MRSSTGDESDYQKKGSLLTAKEEREVTGGRKLNTKIVCKIQFGRRRVHPISGRRGLVSLFFDLFSSKLLLRLSSVAVQPLSHPVGRSFLPFFHRTFPYLPAYLPCFPLASPFLLCPDSLLTAAAVRILRIPCG